MFHLIIPLLPHVTANISMFASHATYVMGWIGNGSDGFTVQAFGFGFDGWIEF